MYGHYKLHESKNVKARGPQIITKTLTILKIWKCALVTILIGAQRKEACGAHSELSACLCVGISAHFMIRVGGVFFV